MMLDMATEEIEDLKTVKKEKQHLWRRVKTMENKIMTLEELQMGKIRVISGLQKEKEDLAKQVLSPTNFFFTLFCVQYQGIKPVQGTELSCPGT